MEGLIVHILKEMSGAPDEFQVLPDGMIDIEGQDPAYLDAESAAGIIREFERRGNDMVIDYEHQTLKDDLQAPAAGWIKRVEYRGVQGLWAVAEWTEKAKTYIANREYRYFSPVILISKSSRKVMSLYNVALTNSPRINNLRPIIAKWDLESGLPNEKNKRKEHVMIEKVKALLKLAAEATEETITEAVEIMVNKVKDLETQVGKLVACKEVIEALGLKDDAKKEEALVAIAGMKAPGDVAVKLSLQVAELQQALASMKQEDLVALALKEGKTSPAELDSWGRDLALKNPDQFKLIVLARPAGSVVPLDKLAPKKDIGGQAHLDDVQLLVNKLCGVDEETFKKYNK